jgi:hypothetical protein
MPTPPRLQQWVAAIAPRVANAHIIYKQRCIDMLMVYHTKSSCRRDQQYSPHTKSAGIAMP